MTAWLERKKRWLGKKKLKRKKELYPEENIIDVVDYIPLRCPKPKCNSKKTRCYCTDLPVRYHICLKCKRKFKSYEKEE